MIDFGTICHGNPFHSSLSRRRPPDLGRAPPHCLKKNATPYRSQAIRNLVAHSAFIGRALGLLPPPTIAHATPIRSTTPIGSSSGSNEMKRASEFICHKCSIRPLWAVSSTEIPSHIWRRHSPAIVTVSGGRSFASVMIDLLAPDRRASLSPPLHRILCR